MTSARELQHPPVSRPWSISQERIDSARRQPVVRGPAPTDAERYVRTFIAAQRSFSETAISLANKLDVNVRITRRVLADLAEAGDLERRTFEQKVEPIYYHYHQPARSQGTRAIR